MPIADCQMPIERLKDPEMFLGSKSAIGNRKSEMFGMVDPPRFTKLGAKWVEVRKRV